MIIVLNDDNGLIKAKKITTAPLALPVVTSAEINYLAFDVLSIDYHIQLYGEVMRKNGISTIKDCDTFIKNDSHYDAQKHHKPYQHRSTTYDTVCTYIRNCIDHPDSGYTYTNEEMRTSIELLIELCR